MRRRLLLLLVQAAVVAALIGGTAGFVAADKTLTLSVDGQHRTIRTYAATVGEVLADEHVPVDHHDLVSPQPAEQVSDGDTVVVRYGRPVVLTVDGETRSVWTTARRVGEALAVFGLRHRDAYVSASRSRRILRSGLALDVRLPHRLTFLVDGRQRELSTTAITLRSALSEAGVSLRARDRVVPGLGTRPADDLVVAITRVDGRRVVEQRPIRFRTVEKRSDRLYVGTREVAREGRVGVQVRTYRETYLDHRLARREAVGTRVTTRPVDRVVLLGTRKVPANTPAPDGLNWAALAACESGGNPRSVNPAGPYYGLYQFSAGTWAAVGGGGLPSQASPDEQTYRAQLLYRRSGAGQWPVCGRNLLR